MATSLAQIMESYADCTFECHEFTDANVGAEAEWRPYDYAGHVRLNGDGSLTLSESTPSDKLLSTAQTFEMGGYFEVEARWEPGVNASPWTGWPAVRLESDTAQVGIVEYLGRPDEEQVCSFRVTAQAAGGFETFMTPLPDFCSYYHRYGLFWWPSTYFSDGRLEWCIDGQSVASLGYRRGSALAEIDLQSFRIALGANNAMPITVKSVTVWQ